MSLSADEPRDGFGAGQRHGWIDRLCSLLERMAAGEAAGEALAGAKALRGRHGVAALPMWVWAEPMIAVGRKADARGGGRLLLPVRVRWSCGPVVVVPTRGRVVRWTARGMGHDAGGKTRIIAVRGLGEPRYLGGGLVPERIEVPALALRRVVGALSDLDADGRAARWGAVQLLGKRADEALRRAHAAVAAEIHGAFGPRLLDEVQLEAIWSSMLLGEDGDPAQSDIGRMLKRMLAPATFLRVDPLRYVVTTLRRDAEAAVRRRVGDPHVGRKVRSLAAELGTKDLDELLAAYAARWPSDHLGERRAAAALALLSTRPAPPVSLHSLPEGLGRRLAG